jgi:hypothetical protein
MAAAPLSGNQIPTATTNEGGITYAFLSATPTATPEGIEFWKLFRARWKEEIAPKVSDAKRHLDSLDGLVAKIKDAGDAGPSDDIWNGFTNALSDLFNRKHRLSIHAGIRKLT